MALGQALFTHIVDFLVPHVESGQERKALVQSALRHLKLINLIEWEGNAHNFAVHLITSLDRWGDNTLELLLNQLSPTVGDDHQKTIQTLIAQIRSATQGGHWEGSPFPGLQAFQERHEPIFFGREQEIYRLAERVRQKPLVAVIGASGSGKSSLIQAGVIPRLKQSREEKWHIIRFTPDQAGVKHPFASLRSALEQHWQTDLPSPDELAEQPALLKDICQTWLSGTQRLLLLVDQFEETFTTIQPTLRTPFIQALCALLDLPHIHIVLTLRSDFSEQAVNEPDLVDRLTPFLLSRPQPWALHQMIAGPAKAAAMTMEGNLIDTILSDTGSEPGNLALLAYTLDELYKIADARHERTIRMEDYTALGGVQGAIGKRAEKAFESLKLDDKEVLLAHVFRDLVEVDDRGTATRKRAPLASIGAEEQKLITAFTKARLLVSDEGWVEVAHEALFRSWERLKTWIAEAQEDLILLRQVQNAAYHWDRTGRPDYLLWPDERLRQVSAMKARLQPKLSAIEWDFLIPEIERLLEEFRNDDREHRRLWIIDRWGKIGERAVDALVLSLTIDHKASFIESVITYSIARVLKPYAASAAPRLIQYLNHKENHTKRQSVVVLGELKDIKAVPLLIQALTDTSAYVRRAAVEALEKLGDASAVTALIEVLKDADDTVRRRAADALAKLGDASAVTALIEVLKDADNMVRRRAADALAKLGDASAVTALIEVLKDTNADVRIAATEALGTLGDTSAVTALTEVLKDANDTVRWTAAKALEKLGDASAVTALIEVLKTADGPVRWLAADTLAKLSDPSVVPALIDVLKDTNPDVRRTAAETLGTLGVASAVPVLIETLKDTNPDVRRAAVEALEKLGDASAVPVLIETLKDANDIVRWAVVQALKKLGDASAVPVIIETLKDTNPDVRRAAVEALEKLGDASAVPALIDVLKDTDANVRWTAVWTLGTFGDTRVVPALIDILKDTDANVRWTAVWTLGTFGDTRAVPALINLLKDSNDDVRRSAVWAVGRLRDTRALPALITILESEESSIVQDVAVAVAQIGDQEGLQALRSNLKIVSFLIEGLSDELLNNNAEIIQTLKAIGTPEALAAVEKWRQEHPEADDIDPSS